MENQGKFEVNEEMSQFELHVGNSMAFLEYVRKDEKIYLTHTEAPVQLQGTGAAQELVRQALQYSKDNGLTVVPSCSYVAHYIDRHTEWRSILSDGYQM